MDYTPKEAAEIFGVCKKTVLRMIANGILPAYKIGNRTIRISEENLNEFKEKRKTI
jgi:excisionase family DNA binding protein